MLTRMLGHFCSPDAGSVIDQILGTSPIMFISDLKSSGAACKAFGLRVSCAHDPHNPLVVP